ncbi:MAG: ChbG/HpnK family deacetylase [Thermoleophilia bacterium]|nr:ChbG/HpnK family deacetylase [Thermoleophilia bacterium]
MRIILNADDFGASADTVRATVECFEAGALTSATIMVGMPATDAALAFARARPDAGFGVHLRLVANGAERPVSNPAELPGLTSPDGCLRATNVVRVLALVGRLPARALEREIHAQIRYVQDRGVEVTHVDSHRHLHKLPAVREALRRVLPGLGVRRVRSVQDVYLGRPLASPTYWVGRCWRRRLAEAFETTAHMYMPATARDVAWEGPLLTRCERLPGGSLEVGVHPGLADGWRAAERRSLLLFADRAREAGHDLISWREL